MLAQLGVTVTDLQRETHSPVPTLREYLPKVIEATGPGARRTYGSYWERMAAQWGDRSLDSIAPSDIEALQHSTVADALVRRTSRGGRHAGEHVIAAARAICNRAVADGLIEPGSSPAHKITKPRRLPSTRRALTLTNWPRSTWPPAPAATTSSSMRFCSGCTRRRHAAAVAPSGYA